MDSLAVQPDQVQDLIDEAEDLLDDQSVQAVRAILDNLQSKARITSIGLPLGTYPAAIKQTINLIHENKNSQAEDSLYSTLNTLVSTTEIDPLPVLEAESLLTSASALEHKQDLSQASNRAQIVKLLDEAKDH